MVIKHKEAIESLFGTLQLRTYQKIILGHLLDKQLTIYEALVNKINNIGLPNPISADEVKELIDYEVKENIYGN